MLQATDLVKRFDTTTALDHLSCSIPAGVVFGLVGSNGAGKSTFLRVIAGIYRADDGQMLLDDQPVFENEPVKEQIVLVPDELYFLSQANLKRMAILYRRSFPNFSLEYCNRLIDLFQLDPKKAIRTFSKGMKRQAAIALALACRPRYLLLDEAFDGLDPLMRDVVRKIIRRDVAECNTTVVISSHSLRELEDTCDWLALLHQGNLIFTSTKDELTQQAPEGLEALFVRRLNEAGYSFETALDDLYATKPTGDISGALSQNEGEVIAQ